MGYEPNTIETVTEKTLRLNGNETDTLSTAPVVRAHPIPFVVFLTADGFPQKPDPTSFSFLIDKYDLVKRETIGIGDREIDVIAALAAGIPSCYFSADSKELNIATFNIHQINELFEILN